MSISLPISDQGTASTGVDVLGLGNSCLDQILALDPFPAHGAVTRERNSVALPGGQVASTLVGCRRLGLSARFPLRIGNDVAGARQHEALRREGIDLGLARVLRGVPSASAYILLDQRRGQRAVLWNTDPRLAVLPEELPDEALEQARLLYLDGKDGPACLAAARRMRVLGRPVVSDIDLPQPWTRDLIADISDCVCNREFLAAYCSASEVESALRQLAREGPEMVCATLGGEGALALAGGQWQRVPALPVTVVDDTGAGDAFRAGYIFGRLAGWPLPHRLQFANATAACACGALGAVASMPPYAAVVAMLRSHHLAGPWGAP